MRHYTIEIDGIIMEYLKKHAEPFADTPNSVLHRLLFGLTETPASTQKFQPILSGHIPKSLLQILEVVYEVIKEGLTRPEATKLVAIRNDTAPQTIIDKYCRQLGKKAYEIDRLIDEPGLGGFKMILMDKFPNHRDMINGFFDDLQTKNDIPNRTANQKLETRFTQNVSKNRRPASTNRKKRDPALEAALKTAIGNQLTEKFGLFAPKGQSQLIFNNARVLCKYSSFHGDQSRRWFWGVAKTYWQNWEDTDCLALIFENEIGNSYSYLLLDSDEAKKLFDSCSESREEKKINMRIYDDEIPRFQEWRGFDVQARTRPLDLE